MENPNRYPSKMKKVEYQKYKKLPVNCIELPITDMKHFSDIE